MDINNILKATGIAFKKYKGKLLAFCFASLAIVGTLLYLSSIINSTILSFVFTFLMIGALFPLLISFKYISLKAIDRKDITTRDFYIGFINYRLSTITTTKLITFTFLFYMGGMLVGSLIGGIGGSLYIMANDPSVISEFMSNSNYETLLSNLSKLSYIEVMSDIVLLLGVFGGLASYSIFGGKLSFSPLIKLETQFSFDNCDLASKNFLKKNKKSLILLNILYCSLIFVVILLGYGVSGILEAFNLSEYIIVLIEIFVLGFVFSVVFMYYELSMTVAYNHYLRKEIQSKNKELGEKLNKN